MLQGEAMTSEGFRRGRRHLLVDIGDRAHAGLHQSDRSLNEPPCKGAGGEAGNGEQKGE